jgi:hypothetical protein
MNTTLQLWGTDFLHIALHSYHCTMCIAAKRLSMPNCYSCHFLFTIRCTLQWSLLIHFTMYTTRSLKFTTWCTLQWSLLIHHTVITTKITTYSLYHAHYKDYYLFSKRRTLQRSLAIFLYDTHYKDHCLFSEHCTLQRSFPCSLHTEIHRAKFNSVYYEHVRRSPHRFFSYSFTNSAPVCYRDLSPVHNKDHQGNELFTTYEIFNVCVQSPHLWWLL